MGGQGAVECIHLFIRGPYSRGGLGVWPALPPALLRWMPADSWGYFGPVGSAEGTARGALTPDSRKEFPREFGKPGSRQPRGLGGGADSRSCGGVEVFSGRVGAGRGRGQQGLPGGNRSSAVRLQATSHLAPRLAKF